MTAARNENTVPSFEILEPRVLLDGDVTAFLAGSTLVIQGDGQSNAVIIYGSATPGQFVVSGVTHSVTGNQTTVNGDLFDLFDGVTSGVKVNMGLGNDELLIGTPGAIATTTIPGNLSIDMGGGTVDGVYIGFDPDAFDFLGNVDILGSLTIQGSDAEDGVAIFGTSVTKNVTMKLGDSPAGTSNFVSMYRNVTTATSNFIGGKLSMTGGDGIDEWFIEETTITGSAQFKLGDTDAGKTDIITIDTSTIFGAVKITGGDGHEEISVLDSTLSSFSAQLKGGDNVGDDHVEFNSATIVGKVKISAGNDCLINILNNSGVFGNLSIRAKGDAQLRISDSSVTGKVNVSGSDAAIHLELDATITGDVAVKGKLETDFATFGNGNIIIDGDVKFSGGSGQDLFRLNSNSVMTGSAKINFRTQNGVHQDLVHIMGYLVGDLSVTGGSGRELLSVNGGTIDGNIKFDMKDAQFAGIEVGNFFTIIDSVLRGNVSIRSKGKFDATLIRSRIDGTLNMKLGKADDKVTIKDCPSFGAFILDTSHGNDTLTIDSLAAAGSHFFGPVTVKMGNGNDLIDIGDIFGDGTFGATFYDECSFDGGSGIADWFTALGGANGNDFQLGVPDYTNFENIF